MICGKDGNESNASLISMKLPCAVLLPAVVAFATFNGAFSWSPNESFLNRRISSVLSRPANEADLEEPILRLSTSNTELDRRQVVLGVAVSAGLWTSNIFPAHGASSEKPQEFSSVSTQTPTPTDAMAPFITLDSGVKYKDVRVGTGEAAVTPSSSNVSFQCSGRLLNLNGVVFYNTKQNNPDGFGAIPLTVDLGRDQLVPGLEQGLVGMKKGGIRRIVVPANLAYSNPLYFDREPKPFTTTDQRALESVAKNSRRDGTILFDVSLERFK